MAGRRYRSASSTICFLAQAGERVGRQDHPATLEGGFDVCGSMNRDDTRLHPERRCGGLDRPHEKAGLRRRVWIEHDADAREAPFAADRELEHAEPDQVAARPSHRVGAGDEDNRDCCGCCLRSLCRGGASCRSEDGDSTANKIGNKRRQPIVLALRPTVFGRYILAFDVAAFLQALMECCHRVGGIAQRPGTAAIARNWNISLLRVALTLATAKSVCAFPRIQPCRSRLWRTAPSKCPGRVKPSRVPRAPRRAALSYNRRSTWRSPPAV